MLETQNSSHKRVFEIRRSSNNTPLKSEERKTFLNLTLVCRQIYTETGMLPFISNTFVFTHPEEAEKWLAQKLLPAQQNAITTIQCPVGKLFFEFARGAVASRHCTNTFKQIEGLKRLVLTVGDCNLSEQDKDCVIGKVRRAHGKKTLKVVFLEESFS